MGEKLTLKHLAPYLPYGLNFQYTAPNGNTECNTVLKLTIDNIDWLSHLEFNKPILRPLLDLTKEHEDELYELWRDVEKITIESRIGFSIAMKDYVVHKMPYYAVEYLISKHYDINKLIEKGLAIDMNTIKK